MYSGGLLEVVENFCYLGDMLGSEGGVKRSVNTRVGTAWRKFRELLDDDKGGFLFLKTEHFFFLNKKVPVFKNKTSL